MERKAELSECKGGTAGNSVDRCGFKMVQWVRFD